MPIDLVSKVLRRRRLQPVLASSDTPNGDALVAFIDPHVWSALRHDRADDEDALSDLLWHFALIWNAAVFEALDLSLPPQVANFLQDQPALVATYVERKRLLFRDDHRLFADVKLIRAGDDLQVHAVAVATSPGDLRGGNTLAAYARRAPSAKTRTDRNRDKRRRRR